MSAVAQSPSRSIQTNIQWILSQQESIGKPSAEVCQLIANLKDMCELQGSASASATSGTSATSPNGSRTNWRNGTGSQQQEEYAFHGGGDRRSNFRGRNNGSSNSLQTLQIPRMQQVNSFGSISSVGSEGHSPVSTPATGRNSSGGRPYTPTVKYQSQFKNSNQPVKDKILNNIILSKLNKFSPGTYEDIRDFLYQILGSGEPDLVEMVRDFMKMVFRKAASEEIYCSLYAKLLAELSARYSVILEEMQNLQRNYLDIFEDIVQVPEGGSNYETFVEKNLEKRYRQGYSQFLAELTALEILDLEYLKEIFQKLVSLTEKYQGIPDKKTLIEEYADCLMRMSKVLQKKNTSFFVKTRLALSNVCVKSLENSITNHSMYCSISPKARFIFMDVKENLEKK